MKFWDSSAIVPLLVEEESSLFVRRLYEGDREVIVFWNTLIECQSAISRKEREGGLSDVQARRLERSLIEGFAQWYEVLPEEGIRKLSLRLLRTHPLRAADATQLASALYLSETQGETVPFVCLDERLVQAARREGVSVISSDDP